MNMIHKLLTDNYQSDSFSDICPIQVKQYFDFKDKQHIFHNFIPKLTYNTRGLYFVPIKPSYSKILYLFKEGDLVVKQEKKTTLNFLIKKTLKSDVYDLYLQGPNNIVKKGIACVPNLKSSLMLRELLDDYLEDVIVECKYNEKFKKWQPLQKTEESISKVDNI